MDKNLILKLKRKIYLNTNMNPIQQHIEESGKQEFVEKGADMEHERWSSWQKYLHSLFPKNEDGSITITPERVKHWERQIATKYSELSEKEKEYDRVEVRKYLPLLFSQQLALVEKIKKMIKEKRRKIYSDKYNSTQEDINYSYNKALDDILQDLEYEKN